MLPNTGAEYFDIIKSKLPIIKSNLPKLKSFLTSGNIGSLFDIAELAWPEMKALPIRGIVERTWGQLLPVLKVNHEIWNHQTENFKSKILFLLDPLPGSSLQVEILSIYFFYLSVCLSVITSYSFPYSDSNQTQPPLVDL